MTEPQPKPSRSFNLVEMHWLIYLGSALVVTVCTLIGMVMSPYFAPENIVMVFLVGIVYVAARFGRGPSILASLLSVLSFDFFLVHPFLTFAVSDTEYIVTFAVMLLVALTISSMTTRIKEQAEAATERERHATSLYELSRDFSSNNEVDQLANIAARHIEALVDSRVVVLLPAGDDTFKPYGARAALADLTSQEIGVAGWAYNHGQPVGLGTKTLPGSRGFYLPLLTPRGKTGVLGLYPIMPRHVFSPDQINLLETFANQTALAIERAKLTDETERAHVQIETERLRNSLLSSVSHDLRTPLAAITGAASGLLQRETLDSHGRELAQIAYEEAERLNRLVGNLLEMTRLESGTIEVDKEWQPLEEVVGTTLMRLERSLTNRPLHTTLPDDLPLVPIDGVLIEQVLVNLVENAVKYAPEDSPIDLSAWADDGAVVVEVADRGAGIPTGQEERIFDKFYRVRPASAAGVGLGLAISRAIIQAHGGRIWAANRAGGGAAFRFTLPLDGEPPHIEPEAG